MKGCVFFSMTNFGKVTNISSEAGNIFLKAWLAFECPLNELQLPFNMKGTYDSEIRVLQRNF